MINAIVSSEVMPDINRTDFSAFVSSTLNSDSRAEKQLYAGELKAYMGNAPGRIAVTCSQRRFKNRDTYI